MAVETTPESPILFAQVDGNNTISTEPNTSSISLPPRWQSQLTQPSTANKNDMNYRYVLNEENQTNRLLVNANKAPLNITYKDVKVLDGKEHATNVNIECSAGMYLSAIKPALEAMHEGWTTVLHGTTITCQKATERMDKSGKHLICTQLVLFLSNPFDGLSNSKVVLHFYHTDNKIQIQGSSLLSGVSTAIWMVNRFLQPLANQHTRDNSGLIDNINNQILAGRHKQCNGCDKNLNPNASQVKDQELRCKKCSRVYHKRCTSRRLSKANWQKEPWFCQYCILGNETNNGTGIQTEDNLLAPGSSTIETLHDQRLDPGVREFYPQIVQPSGSTSPQQSFQQSGSIQGLIQTFHPLGTTESFQSFHPPGSTESNQMFQPQENTGTNQSSHPMETSFSRSIPQLQEISQHEEISSDASHPQAFQPSAKQHSNHPSFQPLAGISSQDESSDNPSNPLGLTVRFPNTGTRQRTSNVNVNDPEKEFLQTALDSCRSNIIQQETELKKLKESLHLRNKKIIQLEGQISCASDLIGSRNVNQSSNPIPTCTATEGIHKSLETLINKIEMISTKPVNNIIINNNSELRQDREEKASQTESSHPPGSKGSQNERIKSTNCPEVVQQDDQIIQPSGSKASYQESSNYICDVCGKGFNLYNGLETHQCDLHAQPDSSPPNSEEL